MCESRKQNRLQNHDYSQPGYYFITICTESKKKYFGEICDGKMVLNEYGKTIKQQWEWLKSQYSYIDLDVFVIMPNHIHGIIIIKNYNNVGTGRDLSLQKIKSISELIGAFKTTSSKLIHKVGCTEFSWQRSFYDHVVRQDESLDKIREYIVNNPLKWELDEYRL